MAAKATKLETAMILKYQDGVDKKGKDSASHSGKNQLQLSSKTNKISNS